MGMSKEEAVKALQNRECVYVAYSQATKLPYVTCDEETYNDQAWVFAKEEGLRNLARKSWRTKSCLWVCAMKRRIIRDFTVPCMQLA